MFLKKGRSSAGVARQYSGTAGRIENCQIGVFLTYATEAGRTFLDRELYLPKEWTADVDRCAAAGIPVERKFATKHWWPLTRSHAHSMPAKWATGDAVYGHHAGLRRALEKRGLHYVLAVPVNQRVIARAGPIGTEFRADELTASLSGRSWRTRSAGQGAKGGRRYAWARARINGANDPGDEHWLLARRSLADQRRSRLTSATHPPGCPWPNSSAFSAPAGPSRKPSRPPRAKPARTTTKCGNSPAGTGT